MSTRKQYDEETKRKVVAERANGVPIKEIVAKYGVHESQIYAWRKKFGTNKPKASKKIKKKSPNKVASAIVLLNHARDAAIKQVSETPERFDDPVYGLAMMALRTLEGKNDNYS
jgi:transposase-like protein